MTLLSPNPQIRTFQSGDIIADRYELRSLVGEGGMGAVWRACHIQLTSEVAIKLMSPAIAAQPEALQRFLREAQAAARLSSLHVVKVFDYGVDGQTPFIAMELLAGESLRERLDRERVLSPSATLAVMRHAARALAKAHGEGIVHRDLKPENLFITKQEEEILKVLDFGVAKLADPTSGQPSTSTRTGAVLGTPFYMSPEQARGIRAVDHRSDLWALGVIAFECLTGKLPFDSEAFGDLVLKICTLPAPVPSVVGAVPAGFDAWFARAVERDPELRFQSADELIEALQPILSDAPPARAVPAAAETDSRAPVVHATRTDGTASHTVMTHIPTQGPSPRAWAWAASALVLGASGVVAFAWLGSDRERHEPAPTSSAGTESAGTRAPAPVGTAAAAPSSGLSESAAPPAREREATKDEAAIPAVVAPTPPVAAPEPPKVAPAARAPQPSSPPKQPRPAAAKPAAVKAPATAAPSSEPSSAAKRSTPLPAAPSKSAPAKSRSGDLFSDPD